MRATRLVITAETRAWARHAAVAATGFATSVIACGCEAGIERELSRARDAGRPARRRDPHLRDVVQGSAETPRAPGRPMRPDLPTTAAYNGVPAEAAHEWLQLGGALRWFGDGWQISKLIGGKRYWRIPVMDGEFVCEEKAGLVKGIGGGNFLILAADRAAALAAAERSIAAMRKVRNVDHAVSGRRGALGLEGRLEVQDADRVDQRCVLPDPRGPHAFRPRAGGRCGAGDRDRRLRRRQHLESDARRHPRGLSRRRGRPACSASRRATTAASSGRITST